MSYSLAGKCILVTGASSGIGQAIAIAAAKAEARVIICARNATRLHDTLAQLMPIDATIAGTNNTHLSIIADLTQEDQCSSLVQQLPSLDGIVHAAGIVKPLPIKYINPKHIHETWSINYTAPVLLTAQLLKQRKIARAASLIFISSIAAQYPYLGAGLYASSKAALEAFCRTIALECAPQKIRANCIVPALVETPILVQMRQAMSPQEFEQIVKSYPLGIGKPADVAAAALFFLSDASSWITGTNLVLDGGLTLSK